MAEYISKEKIEQARKIDLLTYLREYKPYEIVKISGDNYTTKSHDSVRINNGLWYRFSTNEGGKSAIDLLSYATLLKLKGYEWKNQNLISLAGVYQTSKNINESKVPITIMNYLNKNPKTENIILHFDNDIAGRNATKSFVIALQDKYNVYDIPAPYGKDINDYLCYKLGLKNRFQIENYKRSKVHFNVL